MRTESFSGFRNLCSVENPVRSGFGVSENVRERRLCLSPSGEAVRSRWHVTLKAYVKFDDTEMRRNLTLREKSRQDRRFVLKTIQCGWSI